MPIWALVVLHYMTLGVFATIWMNLHHGRLPKRRPDDPSAGRAIGFLFIPIYSFYWLFFTHLRLCERVDRERELRGLPQCGLRELAIATCVVQVIPYVGFLSYLVLYPVFAGMLQSRVNELARLDSHGASWRTGLGAPLPVASAPPRCPVCERENPVGGAYCAFCGGAMR